MDELDTFLDRIDNLPPAPKILVPLLAALEDLNTDTDRVVEMIAIDPVLTAKILQTCNSAYFGAGRPVYEVREAVNRLGFQIVYSLVAVASSDTSFAVAEQTGMDVGRHWRHAVTAAFAGRFIARGAEADVGLFFTAGLLHDIGKLVLAGAFRQDYVGLEANPKMTGRTLAELERATFGFDHAQVGARLLERWNFSAQFAGGVRAHHDLALAGSRESRRAAACLLLADQLAHSFQPKPANPATEEESLVARQTLGVTADQLTAYRDEVAENMHFVDAMCHVRG